MPIYEYRCTNCDRAFEAFVRPGRDEAQCPSCHGAKLVRELSVFAAASSAPRNAENGSVSVPEAPLRGNVCCGGGCGCR